MKSRIYMVVLMICLAASGVGCKYIQRRIYRPSQTVKEFYKYLEAGNADEAAKLFDEAGIERLGGIDEFRKFVAEHRDSIQKAGGIESLQIERERINGEIGEVNIIVKTRQGKDGLKLQYILGWGPKSSGWEIIYWQDL